MIQTSSIRLFHLDRSVRLSFCGPTIPDRFSDHVPPGGRRTKPVGRSHLSL